MALLPRQRSIGEMLATGLGTGIASGAQQLANYKIKQMLENQKIQSLAPTIQNIFGAEGVQQGSQLSGLSDADKQSAVLALQMNRPDLIPQIISKAQARQTKLESEQQRSLERRYKPELDTIQKEATIAEKALPIIQQMKNLVSVIPTGKSKALGRLWGNDAIQQYNELSEQLSGITGIKGAGLPSITLSPKAMNKRLNEMEQTFSSSLMRKDATNDILNESNNLIPKDFTSQLNKRVKLRSYQQKKNTEESNEQYQSAPQVEPIEKNEITPEIQQEEFEEFPEGTPVFGEREPSYTEKLSDILDTDLLGGPISRILSKGASGALGSVGSLVEGITGLGSLATGGMIPRTSLGLPTTESVQKKLFGSRIPESKAEEVLGNIARETAELVGPGAAVGAAGKVAGKIAKVPKWLQTAESFLKISPKAAGAISTAGNSAAAALEKSGAPKSVQEIGKIAVSLGTAAATNRMAQFQANRLANKISSVIEDAKPVRSYSLSNDLSEVWQGLNKGAKTPFKTSLMEDIQAVDKIPMNSSDLWKIRNKISDASKIKGLSESLKQDLPKVASKIEKVIAKGNPQIKSMINDLSGLSKAKDVSSKLFEKMKLLTKRNALFSGLLWSLGLGGRTKLLARLGGTGFGTLGLFGELEKSLKLMNNPAFKRQFGDLVKAGIAAAAKDASTTEI
jgi:hypothetical protein